MMVGWFSKLNLPEKGEYREVKSEALENCRLVDKGMESLSIQLWLLGFHK